MRRVYIHTICGAATKMGPALAETYARDPSYYSHTFCMKCKEHLPVEEFVWDGTGPAVITNPKDWTGFSRVGS